MTKRRDKMFDQAAYIILEVLIVLTFIVVVFGIPLVDSMFRKE